MKSCLLTIGLCLEIFFTANSQYYLQGEVKNEKGQLLSGIKINLSSKRNYTFSSGNSGLFGIASSLQIDTITLSADGYETLRKAVETEKYQVIVMKMLPALASTMKNKLASKTINLTKEDNKLFSGLGESYSSLAENVFVDANHYPETGFSLNIDRASYSNTRRFLVNQMRVPVDAVRIEEMLNYFDLRTNKTNNNHKNFTCNTILTSCPWNAASKLLFINLTAPKINLDTIPSSNLVFLIDVSGSMERPNRLPLLQSAFKLLVENLRAKDSICIVTYGGGVNIRLYSTSGAEKEKINNIIDSLYADGDTPGEGAIRTAYSIARRSFIKNGNNRIILATDGDFNVGQTSEKELEDLISFERQSGIYLTCIGVGMGNYKDSKLEVLAKKGNGNFAYLDNINEAEKVLVTEFTKTVYAVANDAFLNVRFANDYVKEYRLIGFENKKDAVADSSSVLEGGEIGSGHNTTAIFEIIPNKEMKDSSATLANFTLQYHLPGDEKMITQKFYAPCNLQDFLTAPAPVRFAAAVAMFSSLIKQSKFVKYNYEDVKLIAQHAADANNISQQEFILLIQKADKLYNYSKKKRR
ncbi:MAG TPA: von Willebrand factor type A domain-containing protein [Chitinophagaceae bacterium]|nr:von Willebrand factor type A domain-containing protein [Chitinophagaceae bacterium]